MTPEQAVVLQRELARKVQMFDGLVRIPFTQKGLGADALLGLIPGVGDIAGLAMAGYVIHTAWRAGVPLEKLRPAITMALADVPIGMIPIVGDIADIFVRPSQRAFDALNKHFEETYGIVQTKHIEHPVMHRFLERRQRTSSFWRNGRVEWLTLHFPDLLGMALLLAFVFMVYQVGALVLRLLGA